MAIAKYLRNLGPGESTGDEGWSARHTSDGNMGEYSYEAGGQSGANFYSGPTEQRGAAARTAFQVRRMTKTMGNRSREDRAKGNVGNGTQGQPGLTSL
jgi:hypothetical protein